MKRLIAAVLLLLASATAATAQDDASARAFVDSFYQAYVPLARSTAPGSPALRIIDRRPGSVDAELVRALRADYAASVRSKDEVVGLDGDPFLNTQDLCRHYRVGRVTRSGPAYLVEVRGDCSGRVDVLAEVVRRGGRWVFTNFRYPSEGGDLRSLLRQLASDRRK